MNSGIRTKSNEMLQEQINWRLKSSREKKMTDWSATNDDDDDAACAAVTISSADYL